MSTDKPPQQDLYGSRGLSKRELEIIRLVSLGLKNSEVASEVGTTEHVIKNYLRVIYDKTGMNNRTELALWYLKYEEEEKNK